MTVTDVKFDLHDQGPHHTHRTATQWDSRGIYFWFCLQKNEFTRLYRQMTSFWTILTCFKSFVLSICFSFVISKRIFNAEEPPQNSYSVLSATLTCLDLNIPCPSSFLVLEPRLLPLFSSLLCFIAPGVCRGFSSIPSLDAAHERHYLGFSISDILGGPRGGGGSRTWQHEQTTQGENRI